MSARKPFAERCPEYQKQSTLENGLNERHRQLMREIVGGATRIQASARTGFSVSRINFLMGAPLFREEMDKMEDRVDGKFEDDLAEGTASVASILSEAAPKAAEALVALSETGKTESIKLASVKDILDRTGHKAAEEVVVTPGVDVEDAIKHVLSGMKKDNDKDAATG